MTTETQTILASDLDHRHGTLRDSNLPLEPIGGVPTADNGSGNDSETSGDISVPHMSNLRKTIAVLQLTGVNFTSSAVNGLVIVGLPTITADLQLSQALSFWPSSVANLATASTLLLAGALADAIGPRRVDLAGCILAAVFMLGSGGVKTGSALVALRAIQGVGLAMHLSSSVAIVSTTLSRGRSRNIGFGCLGLSQPLGFSFGLVVGGVLVDTIGWRAGWYLYGGITLALSCIGLWALPKSHKERSLRDAVQIIRKRVDWVGALLASAFMTMLSYLLAVLSTDVNKIKDAECITLLCLTVVALPAFVAWGHRQVQQGKPALIPNFLWKNLSFTSMCGTVTLSFAVLNSMELFASLFFQEVQHLSALQASIRILPSLVVGTILNLSTGFFVDRIPALWIVTVTSVLCAVAPVLMAVIQPHWTYWGNAFVAQLLMPISCDVLFTVGLIVITDVFPENTQALAGAVFNTASQFGNAFGLAIMQIVSTTVTKDKEKDHDPNAVMDGFRASFWTMFAITVVYTAWGVLGLRKTGRVGLKRD